MALNSSWLDIIEDRRREVAALRRRRYTVRQIVRALEKANRLNPKTEKPWDVATIQRDIQTLRAEAHREALKDTSEHKAEILADYQELIRLGWVEKRYEDVRKVLKDMRELLGTDAPQVVVYEQLNNEYDAALGRLEREFGHDPALLGRIYDTLTDASGQDSGAARSLN